MLLDMLSCYIKKINVYESLYLKLVKVFFYYENKGIKYICIGYLKFKQRLGEVGKVFVFIYEDKGRW